MALAFSTYLHCPPYCAVRYSKCFFFAYVASSISYDMPLRFRVVSLAVAEGFVCVRQGSAPCCIFYVVLEERAAVMGLGRETGGGGGTRTVVSAFVCATYSQSHLG